MKFFLFSKLLKIKFIQHVKLLFCILMCQFHIELVKKKIGSNPITMHIKKPPLQQTYDYSLLILMNPY